MEYPPLRWEVIHRISPCEALIRAKVAEASAVGVQGEDCVLGKSSRRQRFDALQSQIQLGKNGVTVLMGDSKVRKLSFCCWILHFSVRYPMVKYSKRRRRSARMSHE